MSTADASLGVTILRVAPCALGTWWSVSALLCAIAAVINLPQFGASLSVELALTSLSPYAALGFASLRFGDRIAAWFGAQVSPRSALIGSALLCRLGDSLASAFHSGWSAFRYTFSERTVSNSLQDVIATCIVACIAAVGLLVLRARPRAA